MSSGLDWERFGVIRAETKSAFYHPPLCLKKGWVYPLLSISLFFIGEDGGFRALL